MTDVRTETVQRLPTTCRACGERLKTRAKAWRFTPRGRPWCPECGTVARDWRRDRGAAGDGLEVVGDG